MANAEGYNMARTLIACFMILGLAGLGLIATGRTTLETVKEFFVGLGMLAAMFGLPGIIQTWVVTRGTGTAPVKKPDLGAEE